MMMNDRVFLDANIVATMMEYEIKKLITWNIDDFKKFDEIELKEVEEI